ncbi:MAG: hypothetical protein JNN05_05705 [Candidatus Omnitrophica bacterium]|nr:hypothetical protein [Candidatus Omnitrophota bacterium]
MGDAMRNLTVFQHKCESQLQSILRNRNLNFFNQKLDGKKEMYIYGEVKGLEIWIYKDGAEIGGKNIDKRFEKDDFESEEELIDAFKNEVESLLESN